MPVIMEPVLYIDRVELSSAIVRVRVTERTNRLAAAPSRIAAVAGRIGKQATHAGYVSSFLSALEAGFCAGEAVDCCSAQASAATGRTPGTGRLGGLGPIQLQMGRELLCCSHGRVCIQVAQC